MHCDGKSKLKFECVEFKSLEVPRADLNKSHEQHQWGSNWIKKDPHKDPQSNLAGHDRCPRKFTRPCRDKSRQKQQEESLKDQQANISQKKETTEPGKSSRTLSGTARKGITQACRGRWEMGMDEVGKNNRNCK